MGDERQGARYWTHDEVKEAIGPDREGGYDADIGYSAGQRYLLRRVRVEHIHFRTNRQPVATPGGVALVDAGLREADDAGPGYDWAGLVAAVRSRASPPAPIVVDDWAGAVLLVDGYHRVLAHAALGRKTLPAFVRLPEWKSRAVAEAQPDHRG